MEMKTKKPRSWLYRHAVVFLLAAWLLYLFLVSRNEWSAMHRWNRAFGDVSFVLIAAAMVVGPLSRLSRRPVFRRLLAYRRELGIYAVASAVIHTVIILLGWVELDLVRLFGFEFHPQLQRYVMVQHGFALANIVGLAALGYGLMLAFTSNNFSQRVLGASVWKFIQQATYVLWALTVAHTLYFLFLHFLDFHRRTPDPNWAQWPFVVLTVSVLLLQWYATWVTWQQKRRPQTADGDA